MILLGILLTILILPYSIHIFKVFGYLCIGILHIFFDYGYIPMLLIILGWLQLKGIQHR